MELAEELRLALPTKLPDGVLEWLKKKGCFKAEYIIYRAGTSIDPITSDKSRVVECKCTACERCFDMPYTSCEGCCHGSVSSAPFGWFNEATNEHVISGMATLCPYCGAETTTYHIGRMRPYHEENGIYPMTAHRIDGRFALIGWSIVRRVDKEACVYTVVHPYEAYVFDGKRCYKYAGYYKYFSTWSWLGEWEHRKKCVDTWGDAELMYPFNPALLEGTSLENSKLDLFLRRAKEPAPVTYLRIYQRHPTVENLVTSGAADLVSQMIKANCRAPYGYYGPGYIGKSDLPGVIWKARRPAQMLGLNKDEYRRALASKWDPDTLKYYRGMKERGMPLNDEELDIATKVGRYACDELLRRDDVNTREELFKVCRYLLRQKKKYPRDNVSPRDLTDYWDMASQLHDELAERYPQRLKRAHDLMTDRINKIKVDLRKEKFAARYEKLKALSFESSGLIIVPAKSEEELRREGKALHHCVASYAERHANGQTAIFFIRHTDKPDVPYFTLELDEKQCLVRQNRGQRNCDRTEEIIAFEAEFLKYLKSMKGKKR